MVILGQGGAGFTADPVASASRARHVLRSDKLTVEVMDPNHPERYNRGVRFSSVANILQVTMDGKTFLFCPDEHDPRQDNAGLAGEFDIATKGGPPGFAAAGEGEPFLKIGVGILRKSGNTYDFFKPYAIEEAARTEAQWTENSASFRQVCRGTGGFAYDLAAEIVVQADSVVVTWRLANTGTKGFTTEHYLHNFFSFDGAPVGPGYVVEFPYDFDPELQPGSQPGIVRVEGRRIAFDETIETHVNAVIPGSCDKNAPRTVKTTQVSTGQKILATSSLPVLRTFLHATGRYVCPEQFVRISLPPGEAIEWSRRYDFFGR